jgi:hypothetical protein
VRNVLYISYGTGLHEQEAVFSLLSAWRWAPPKSDDVHFLILTDHPESFTNLPATVELITADQWREWAGPTQFNHRRKILALQYALSRYCAPTVLLDADTWLRKPPRKLFERIAPGKTIMHIREARISEIATPQGRMIVDFLTREQFVDSDERDIRIPIHTAMWNAGVIGIDPADTKLLDEVLLLTDQFCGRSTLHVLEQLAFSYVLSLRTHLQEAHDIVFHYWPPYLHEPFKQKLPEIMGQITGLSLEDRIAKCYEHRPRPTLPRRGKVVLKRGLQSLGLLRGRSRSNEW